MNAVFNAVCVAALVFGLGSLAWAATFGMRALLKGFDSPFQQPGDSPRPPTGGVVRCRPRVVLGDTRIPSTALAPRRAA